MAAVLRDLAANVGDRLTDILLSPDALKTLGAAVSAGLGGEPPLLHLRVRPAGGGEAAERRADRALSLPWELLRLDGRFPVEDGTLDLAREAVVPGAWGSASQPAARRGRDRRRADRRHRPRLEEEMYRLWRALGQESEERRLLVTDLGTLDDLVREVGRFKSSRHPLQRPWRTGVLFFEDEAALKDKCRSPSSSAVCAKPVRCHGWSISPPATAPRPGPIPRLSKGRLSPRRRLPSPRRLPPGRRLLRSRGRPPGDAGRGGLLHRPRHGRKAREALRRARRISAEPHQEQGRFTYVYPLGWAQLAFYHRGEDVPTSLPSLA